MLNDAQCRLNDFPNSRVVAQCRSGVGVALHFPANCGNTHPVFLCGSVKLRKLCEEPSFLCKNTWGYRRTFTNWLIRLFHGIPTPFSKLQMDPFKKNCTCRAPVWFTRVAPPQQYKTTFYLGFCILFMKVREVRRWRCESEQINQILMFCLLIFIISVTFCGMLRWNLIWKCVFLNTILTFHLSKFTKRAQWGAQEPEADEGYCQHTEGDDHNLAEHCERSVNPVECGRPVLLPQLFSKLKIIIQILIKL